MGAETARKRKSRIKAKGIFCIEGDWWGRLEAHSSVRPALELLSGWDPYNYIPFVHRDVATRDEFEHYIRQWCQKRARKFPILYLAFHGSPAMLHLGDGRRRENDLSLDELEELLAGCCGRRIIHLGGCGTVDIHGSRLKRFLRETGALAVCGYCEDANWLEAAAFELLIFSAMQINSLTISGARAIKRRIEGENDRMARRLGFRMVVRS